MGCLSSPFLRLPSHPSSAAHSSDTAPRLGARSKTAPASPPFPFRRCHGFSFRWVVICAHAHGALSPAASEASSIRQGDGQRFQKKAMKTTNSRIEASAPANGRPSSVSKHHLNRGLPTPAVLNLLRTQLPRQYEVAEVVGKWVWLDVSPARQPMLAKMLWALGFHWNQRRSVWQHPCGSFNPLGSHPTDPRSKYRSFFPADVLPA